MRAADVHDELVALLKCIPERSGTLKKMATELDVSLRALTYWRSGQRRIPVERYEDVASLLGYDLQWLLKKKEV